MTHAMQHCDRPWWKRPPTWFIAIALLVLIGVFAIERTDKPASMPYGAFLDQVEADNIASVTFHGTEINGRFKRPLDSSSSVGTTKGDSFRTHVPDFGDPALIPALRSRHVTIDVASPSAWSWLLGRVPWPMLIVIGAVLVAGFIRLVRGRQAQPGTAASALPAHGLPGLVSRLFAKQRPSESSPPRDSDEPKSR